MLDHIAFLSCLQFAISNSIYSNNNLKPKQVICLECMYLKRNVIWVLPTGYGKSLAFQLLPGLMFAKEKLRDVRLLDIDISVAVTIIIVVSPLNALISNQISCLGSTGIRASVLGIKVNQEESKLDPLKCDLQHGEDNKLQLYLHIQNPLFHVNLGVNCSRARHTKTKYVPL